MADQEHDTLAMNPDDESTATEVELQDDLDVEVVDDTPERDRGRAPVAEPVAEPTEEELSSYSDKVKERISKLTRARHDERREKEAALRQLQEFERVTRALHAENQQLRSTVSTGEQIVKTTSTQAAEAELREAKRRYKDAYESGDADKVAEAAAEVTRATLRVQAAENFRPTPVQAQQEVLQPQHPSPAAPVAPSVDERTQRWQRANPWFGASGQEEMTSFALGLHQKLVNSGVDPRSETYFERIDARMREVFPEAFDDPDPPERPAGRTPPTQRPASVVAPAARTSAGARRVQLTATQVQIAKRLGLTPQQYATELVKLERSNG